MLSKETRSAKYPSFVTLVPIRLYQLLTLRLGLGMRGCSCYLGKYVDKYWPGPKSYLTMIFVIDHQIRSNTRMVPDLALPPYHHISTPSICLLHTKLLPPLIYQALPLPFRPNCATSQSPRLYENTLAYMHPLLSLSTKTL